MTGQQLAQSANGAGVMILVLVAVVVNIGAIWLFYRKFKRRGK